MTDLVNEMDRELQGNARKPWLAALCSVMLPGLGQTYNGQINRGLWFFLIFALFAIPGVTLAAIYLPSAAMLPALLLSNLIGIGTWLYSIVDAWRQARRLKQFQPRPWQSGGLYFALFIVCNLILLPITINYVRQNQVQAFRIPSGSMSPALIPGDFLFADMRYNCPFCAVELERGDIVIFVYPNNRSRYYIKRVVGLPGDTLKVGDESVQLLEGNEKKEGPVVEKGPEGEQGDASTLSNSESSESMDNNAGKLDQDVVLVPNGHIYVVGDNYNKSRDSRSFGPVPLVDVVGRARQIWFSKTEDGVRWDRIGQLLD